ncbi:TBC1 domain family member 8 [Sciurus carolinensis]|uniref:TBC1 domain family member 8 n=1 Tax=Sciurus carolinensis TaxID=30640 RepID=A0AA41SQ08_SCICA|nr:TBC1 domain family member 8 [Sciurus carolinensis]
MRQNVAKFQLVIPWIDIQKLERTSNIFLADTIWITTLNKEHDSSMLLILDTVFKIMEQLVDVILRRLLDNEVVSMEKLEDTSLLPSPIIVSIRSKMAFQFIELKDRETLVEGLLEGLKQVHANHPMHYDTSTNDEDMTSPVLYLPSICSDHKFGDLEMVSSQSSKEREDKSPPLHPEPLTAVLQPSGKQNPDSRLVVEATPSLLCHGHWRLGNDHGWCGI